MPSWWDKRKTETIKLEEVEVDLFGLGKAKWVTDTEQQQAAWELYVELVTRVAVQPLPKDEGVPRETLDSLHELFAETRRILKAHGPGVAHALDAESVSFGEMAVTILNKHVRPVLTKWHPALLAHETKKAEGEWAGGDEMRRAVENLRQKLTTYAALLARAAGIDPLEKID